MILSLPLHWEYPDVSVEKCSDDPMICSDSRVVYLVSLRKYQNEGNIVYVYSGIL